MKRKPIKIDWDELEVAFSSQNEDEVYYLDLVTGHVVLEGEGGDDEEDDDFYGAAAAAPSPGRDDATRAYVEPMDDRLKIDWMRQFVESAEELEPDVAEQLRGALDQEDAATVLRDVLNAHAEVRDNWYLYRSDRLHDHIDGWLRERGVEATDAPPWET